MKSMMYRAMAVLTLAAVASCSDSATAPKSAVSEPSQVAFARVPNASGANVPVNFTSALGSFAGVFKVTQFAVQNGQLVAIGTLTGTVTNALGQVVGTVNQALTLNVLSATGSCQILHLELGPLDLNLLGLQVHLDKVVLDITAQSGPGNLLGNLLCAVANLLNGGGPLGALQGLLNQILAAL